MNVIIAAIYAICIIFFSIYAREMKENVENVLCQVFNWSVFNEVDTCQSKQNENDASK